MARDVNRSRELEHALNGVKKIEDNEKETAILAALPESSKSESR